MASQKRKLEYTGTIPLPGRSSSADKTETTNFLYPTSNKKCCVNIPDAQQQTHHYLNPAYQTTYPHILKSSIRPNGGFFQQPQRQEDLRRGLAHRQPLMDGGPVEMNTAGVQPQKLLPQVWKRVVARVEQHRRIADQQCEGSLVPT